MIGIHPRPTQQRRAQMGRNSNDEGWGGESKLAIINVSLLLHCQEANKQYGEYKKDKVTKHGLLLTMKKERKH